MRVLVKFYKMMLEKDGLVALLVLILVFVVMERNKLLVFRIDLPSPHVYHHGVCGVEGLPNYQKI